MNHDSSVTARITICLSRNSAQCHSEASIEICRSETCLYQITTASGPPVISFVTVYPIKTSQYAPNKPKRQRETTIRPAPKIFVMSRAVVGYDIGSCIVYQLPRCEARSSPR